MKNKTKRLLLIGGTGFLGKNICKFLDSVGVEYLAVGTDLVAAGYRSSLLKVIDDFQPTGVIFLAAKVGSMVNFISPSNPASAPRIRPAKSSSNSSVF